MKSWLQDNRRISCFSHSEDYYNAYCPNIYNVLAYYMRRSWCAGKGCLNTGCFFGMDKPILLLTWPQVEWKREKIPKLFLRCFLPKLIWTGSDNKENAKCSAFHLQNSTCFLGLLSETARLLSSRTQFPSHPVQNSPFREQSKYRDHVNTAVVMYSSRSDSPLSMKGLMLLSSKYLLG